MQVLSYCITTAGLYKPLPNPCLPLSRYTPFHSRLLQIVMYPLMAFPIMRFNSCAEDFLPFQVRLLDYLNCLLTWFRLVRNHPCLAYSVLVVYGWYVGLVLHGERLQAAILHQWSMTVCWNYKPDCNNCKYRVFVHYRYLKSLSPCYSEYTLCVLERDCRP